jgi:hypothetical protein
MEVRGTFSQYSAISDTLFSQERSAADSEATANLANTPSAWEYSFREGLNSKCPRPIGLTYALGPQTLEKEKRHVDLDN